MNIIGQRPGRFSVDPLIMGTSPLVTPSIGVSKDSTLVSDLLRGHGTVSPARAKSEVRPPSLEERLYDALAGYKVHTAKVAMHLDRDWRKRLFRQLDGLLAVEHWEPADVPPQLSSFVTFLRTILALNLRRRPGLSATTDGHLIASWTSGEERLSIEFLGDDRVKWIVSRPFEGEIEYAAGISDVLRLPAVLSPFSPEHWFDDDEHLHPK